MGGTWRPCLCGLTSLLLLPPRAHAWCPCGCPSGPTAMRDVQRTSGRLAKQSYRMGQGELQQIAALGTCATSAASTSRCLPPAHAPKCPPKRENPLAPEMYRHPSFPQTLHYQEHDTIIFSAACATNGSFSHVWVLRQFPQYCGVQTLHSERERESPSSDTSSSPSSSTSISACASARAWPGTRGQAYGRATQHNTARHNTFPMDGAQQLVRRVMCTGPRVNVPQGLRCGIGPPVTAPLSLP